MTGMGQTTFYDSEAKKRTQQVAVAATAGSKK
jgi:hypothetical protein